MLTAQSLLSWRERLSRETESAVRSMQTNPYDTSLWQKLAARRNYYLSALAMRLERAAERKTPSRSWYQACYLLGLVGADRSGNSEAMAQLRRLFDMQMSPDGAWKYKLSKSFQLMQGYPLAHVFHRTGEERYRRALAPLADLARRLERTSTGTITYTAGSAVVFVDTIGLICPFLVSCGRLLGASDLIDSALHQIQEQIEHNLHEETRLPFHGYYAGGPYRLGLPGWGRGVGWYMMGLADVAIELPDATGTAALQIQDELRRVATALAGYQRRSGHWGAQVLAHDAPDDASATCFIAYALIRCIKAGIIVEPKVRAAALAAAAALARDTRPDGRIPNSSSEALGLGVYGRTFQPQPWTQGLAVAVAHEVQALLAPAGPASPQ